MKAKIKFIFFSICMMLCLGLWSQNAFAATDEILNYDITVDVNPNATLNIVYDIEWKVLESDSAGPLEWVKIGTPNKYGCNYTALSDTISDISILSKSGETFAKVVLDRKYYAGETVKFSFSICQDYMYQVNQLEDGYTVYEFIPGWFDDIDVDHLKIRWNASKVEQWSPSCSVEGGYCVWETSLRAGHKTKISVTYPNDAYSFDMSKTIEANQENNRDSKTLVLYVAFMTIIVDFFAIFMTSLIRYKRTSNLGTSSQVVRTKIVYYPSCPNCGAARGEDDKKCKYCGTSLVKSSEVLQEKNVSKEDKEALLYKKNGTYKYTSAPNTYVNVVVKKPARSASRSSGYSSCAHSSCACACACACAGGGRAGCSMKDFYNTNLKLKQLKKRAEQ